MKVEIALNQAFCAAFDAYPERRSNCCVGDVLFHAKDPKLPEGGYNQVQGTDLEMLALPIEGPNFAEISRIQNVYQLARKAGLNPLNELIPSTELNELGFSLKPLGEKVIPSNFLASSVEAGKRYFLAIPLHALYLDLRNTPYLKDPKVGILRGENLVNYLAKYILVNYKATHSFLLEIN